MYVFGYGINDRGANVDIFEFWDFVLYLRDVESMMERAMANRQKVEKHIATYIFGYGINNGGAIVDGVEVWVYGVCDRVWNQ